MPWSFKMTLQGLVSHYYWDHFYLAWGPPRARPGFKPYMGRPAIITGTFIGARGPSGSQVRSGLSDHWLSGTEAVFRTTGSLAQDGLSDHWFLFDCVLWLVRPIMHSDHCRLIFGCFRKTEIQKRK